MNRLALLLWLMNMAADISGQICFKVAASHGIGLGFSQHWKHMAKRPWIWLGIACYGCEFFIWLAFLTQVPLSRAMMLSSMNIVAIMMAGRIFFGESLTFWRLVGMSLIVAGVVLVGITG